MLHYPGVILHAVFIQIRFYCRGCGGQHRPMSAVTAYPLQLYVALIVWRVDVYSLLQLIKFYGFCEDMSTESKVRIYKTNVRPVLTYASETRAATTNIHQLLRTTDMKPISAIHGKSLQDKIRRDQLRQLSGIQDIIQWTNVRRREWDAHVERMEDNRLAKIARDNRPQGVRRRGRPKKRWKESLNKAPST